MLEKLWSDEVYKNVKAVSKLIEAAKGNSRTIKSIWKRDKTGKSSLGPDPDKVVQDAAHRESLQLSWRDIGG